MPRLRIKHSRLYYRNTLFVWGFAIFAFVAAVYSPNRSTTFLWLIPLIYLNYLLWRMYLSAHPMRIKQPLYTPSDATLTYEDVRLTTSDGLVLAGWFVPGKNRAAVILVHGLGGSKVLMLNHARALAYADYAVLMIDLRAHGESQGDTITGMHEANDVLAGVEYLKNRGDLDPGRIGAIGVSLGAIAVLRAAERSESIRGVILDGMGPTCLADHGRAPQTFLRKFIYPFNWFVYRLGDWMCGERITRGVLEILPHLWPRPVLLIAAGRGGEIAFNRLFFRAAREPKDLWEVPKAAHASAYLFEPVAYRDRIRSFFQAALLGEA